ncbi:MAG: Gfo/Idh/MocA family oxidoreductase [Chloroflexota bacterium]
MNQNETIRWGILSTAQIATSSFLPALRAAGGGSVQSVGGRNLERTQSFAADNGIANAVEGYEAVIEDPNVDAVYNPLPNSLHAEWTARALRAGKAVFCEKPLCVNLGETESLLREAVTSGALLWEAFVFPFRPQHRRILDILSSGTIGTLAAVESSFHFVLDDPGNIRFSADLAGGALNDVGCYPIHFGSLLLDTDSVGGVATATVTPDGVDGTCDGIMQFGEGRTLHFSCGMVDHVDNFGRVIGTKGDIRLSNPFHPGADDTLEIHAGGKVYTEHPVGDEPSFTAAIQHIHAVLRQEAAPEHLATVDALRTARCMQIARDSAGIR